MYGSMKANKTAQSSRHNMKFFDSAEFASPDGIHSNEVNNFSGSKMPTYFAVNSFLQNENHETSNDSILKGPNFGNLPIKINERNMRHNIKFFNSAEMHNQSQQPNQKLPGYFQVKDMLQTMDNNANQTTKLFI